MKKRVLVTTATALAMTAIMNMSVFAVSGKKIDIPANQTWRTASEESRTGKHSDVKVRCDSVRPKSGDDNYTQIQARITTSSGTLMMYNDYERLVECGSSGDFSFINIKNGYLGHSNVIFQFRGNTSSPADAYVSYSAR